MLVFVVIKVTLGDAAPPIDVVCRKARPVLQKGSLDQVDLSAKVVFNPEAGLVSTVERLIFPICFGTDVLSPVLTTSSLRAFAWRR